MLTPKKHSHNAGKENQQTPIKIKLGVCVVCGKKGSDQRVIHSQAGHAKGLGRMLQDYIQINVAAGSLCRCCEGKLITIDKKVIHMQGLYSVKYETQKRCVTSTPDKRETKRSNISQGTPTKIKSPQVFTPERSQPISPHASRPQATVMVTPVSTQDRPTKKKLFATPVTPVLTPRPILPHPQHPPQKTPWGPITSTPLQQRPPDTESVKRTPSTHDHGYSTSPVLPPATSGLTRLVSKIQEISSSTELDNVVLENECGLKKLANRKHGYISVLMTNRKAAAYDLLTAFSWEAVVIEFAEKFPTFFFLLVNLMLPQSDRRMTSPLSAILPRLGLIYAIVVQCRNPELSCVQRLMSTILADSLAPVQLYDRLSQAGICLSYPTSVHLLDQIKGDFNTKLIESIKAGKNIRLVGDNINFHVGVRDERKSRHGRMMHYFGSAILVKELSFPDLTSDTPQLLPHEITTQLLLPNVAEIDDLIQDYAYMAMKVASNKMPFFSFLKKDLPTHLTDRHSEKLLQKTLVIPLPAIPRNEQYYGDVMEILRDYIRILREAFVKAGIPVHLIPRIHIGGDQLTRERFSGAKRNIIGRHNLAEGFEILSPITSEYFHMAMNLLQVPFTQLWKAGSSAEIGTLKAAQNRLHRNSVKPTVKDAYSADKDFFVSFVDAHIIELVSSHFKMENVESVPTQNIPDDEPSYAWAQEQFAKLIRNNVGTFVHKHEAGDDAVRPDADNDPIQPANAARETFFDLDLPDGTTIRVDIEDLGPKDPLPEDPGPHRETDQVQNYASQVLELGLLFKNFIETIKVPNRDRMIRTLKVMMVLLKANNVQSKYSDEILRFLIHQLAILPEQDAHIMFYSMFVNTKGRIDTHIPCDLQMEFIVRVCKKHIKHMYSNKTEDNIRRKTGALAAVNDIIRNYDVETQPPKRSNRHSTRSKDVDEELLINDLRGLRPFETHANRTHGHFAEMHDSLLGLLDYQAFLRWMSRRIKNHRINLGN